MPLACRFKIEHGPQFCVTDCPANVPCGVFEYVRIERPEHVPHRAARAIDVAVLDMNAGWPNLGHDSLLHAVLDAACDLLPILEDNGLRIRALSYDVRRAGVLPEPPGKRFALYLGSGGPGHLDPRRNDGSSEGSQGIREDPSWEAPLFRLLDEVEAHPSAAFLAVCHTYGILCRWAGVAEPAFRGPAKGKSSGVLENVLTLEGQRHPWFQRLAQELPDGRRLRVVDNRLFDLIPIDGFGGNRIAIGYESGPAGSSRGEAVTMIEFARDRGGVMPRVFGVNHHPEIVDRARQRMLLEQKWGRGEVTREWYEERAEALTRTYPDENSDQRLHVTSDYTLLGPLRFYLQRAVRERSEALGLSVNLHEDRLLEAAGVA
jgi:hypothetical protein